MMIKKRKRPIKPKKQSNLPLPEKIMTNIFLLLPFESILACKLVSKKFKNLIHHPNFFSSYHHKSLTLFTSNGGLYCLFIRHNVINNNIVDVGDGNRYPSYTLHRIPINGHAQRLLSESSNAMACVGTTEDQFLFHNLFTGASCTVVDDAPTARRLSLVGFGYDRDVDDYKIMVRKFDVNKVESEEDDQFRVYSFKRDAWKTLQGFPYSAYRWPPSHQACFLNGVLHWVVPKREEQVEVIVTYDLHSSRFGEISLPVDRVVSENKSVELCGQLCYWFCDDHGVHVWVMKEYGVEESWAKLFSLDESKLITGGFSTKEMALCESRDGRKIVLFVCSDSKALIWYDMEDGSTKVVEYDEPREVKRWERCRCTMNLWK